MSLALIQEAAKEVRRLAIAGSPLAVGDFRLKKLVAPLQQAGAKVPVFAQVAKAVEDLVNGSEADSASQLLNLGTLLNAILYTQGQSGAEGERRELEAFTTNSYSTKTPSRLLKPLVQALTTTGSGRHETVLSACERGVFTDLRLIDPAIQALGDSYPELADLVAERILPGFGPGIVPRLKTGLDLKGKKNAARTLTIMHQLDPAGSLEICKTALEEGSPEIKAAAVGCLGKHDGFLPLVLEQARSKNKVVRTAALEALAGHDRPEITQLFCELIEGKAFGVLAGPLKSIKNPQVLNSLIAEGLRVLDALIKGDAEQIVRFGEILDCLEKRKNPECEKFLLTYFDQDVKISKLKAAKNSQSRGVDVVARLALLLCDLGSPKAHEAVLEKRNALPSIAFGEVLRSAILTWSPEKVFEEFAPLLGEKKGAGKQKGEAISHTIWTTRYSGVAGFHLEIKPDVLENLAWDPRWLDAAINADLEILVCCLARPGHKGAISFLLDHLNSKSESWAGLIIEALARCKHPKITETFLDQVGKKAKGTRPLDYDLQSLFQSARYLPVADLSKLDDFAAKLDEKFLNPFLEALASLRAARISETAP